MVYDITVQKCYEIFFLDSLFKDNKNSLTGGPDSVVLESFHASACLATLHEMSYQINAINSHCMLASEF